MDGKNQRNPIFESKLFKIPIEQFEEDMEVEMSKGKKNEILDLFNNYNKIRSEKEFREIKDKLHQACRGGDVDLIKIYLSETIENKSNTLQFKIDETSRAASLLKVNDDIEEATIPRIVEHESIEYLITSISGTGKNLITLKFEENSVVKTIYGKTFSNSKIEEIYFPASLKELKEGWCSYTYCLKKITISPLNGQFKMKEDKYLIGKSDSSKDEFDNLIFACRDIKEISIPSNIKIISSFAFHYSNDLIKVEIPPNSNLQTIGKYAFSSTKISEIKIPSTVSQICGYAFSSCSNLTKVEIPTNSKLKTIEKHVFSFTKIKEIFIPPTVSKICEFAFSNCFYPTKVEISTDSNLQTIEKYAFYESKIKEIFIPSKVSKICKGAFFNCTELIKVEIPINSNLQTIESNAFSFSKIKNIYFPTSLKELEDEWCSFTKYLTKVTISPLNDQFKMKEDKYLIGKSDSNKDEFDNLIFACRDIKEISIPSNIKIISSFAFHYSNDLIKVEIPINSKLEIIESNAFSYTKIKEILIPSTVSEICISAFSDCSNLIKVEIPTNSNLQTIGKYAFYSTKIKDFFIPSKVLEIGEHAFSYCTKLQIIEISEDSKLEIFLLSAFDKMTKLKIMISSSLKKLIHTNKPI